MKQILFSVLCFVCLLGGLRAECSADPSLLLWLPFDEAAGMMAIDRSPNDLEADLSNVQWATGEFGTAVRFGGTNAFINLPPVPGLNGATQFTFSVWATWDDPAPRRYPNLLTSTTWSPGGLMFFVMDDHCSFRMGRPGERASIPGNKWSETSVGLLSALPQNQWTHLCVTFSMPNLVTYVNGKLVNRVTWNYPAEVHDLRLGGWGNSVCHNGLIDDLRIYSRALAESEITALADASSRTRADYTLVDTSTYSTPLVATFENQHATLDIDTHGQAVSLRKKDTGRELLAYSQPFVSIRLNDGRTLSARHVEREGNRLIFDFQRGYGSAEINVDTHRDFFTFTVRALTVTNATALTFCSLPVNITTYRGTMANMLSDDEEAVCLRGYDLPVEMGIRGNELSVWTTAKYGLTGWRAGLAVGSKSAMPKILRSMAKESGVPYSKLGGPWSLGAEETRGSYLFADLHYPSTDDWFELARRGGFSTIHLHGWWENLGHYGVRTNYFPRGIIDMKETVDRIHAAGLRAGIHTLTACIDTRDSWVTPEASEHLIPWDTYTLARPFSLTGTVLYVHEKPSARHDVVFTYSGNGNAIRVGSEIIQYTEISRELPYAFLNCTRGAFKTRPSAHAAGARADYLQQRYMAFYPQPDSSLADELAACIGQVFKTCNLDQLYFDGSEGMMSRYGIDTMRHKIFKQLNAHPLIEGSCYGAHNWWFHSRLGTWDHPVWAPKRFHDAHVAACANYRNSDLLEPQMGWWAPRMASSIARGHFLDDMEYFACKNLGLDAAMSIQGVNVSCAPLPFHIEKQFTLLGWYEHLRLAHYFDTQTVARIAVPGEEFRLRQNRAGLWQFTPVTTVPHRISAIGNGSETWNVFNSAVEQPVSARIEALYTVAPYDTEKRKVLVGEDDFDAFEISTASATIKLQLAEEIADTRGGARNLHLSAENKGTTSSGAWARAVVTFPIPYRSIAGTGAFGVWVKGDGTGALLNLQVSTPREFMHALSDHMITLDFTGWRYVEFLVRERDVDRMHNYVWPYTSPGSHALYRTALDLAHIVQVAFYLNDLPPGVNVDVTISPMLALPTQSAELKNPVLTLNGQALVLPLALKSGDFAEIEPDGLCTHYNEKGDPVARVRPAKPPMLSAGDNAIHFDCEKPQGPSARAEVTFNVFGSPFGTLNHRRKIGWEHLEREYEMTRVFLDSNEVDHASWEVAVRPGEKAAVEIELCGAMTLPVLTLADCSLHFPVTLKDGDRLFCRDGRNWIVLDANRVTVAEGQLKEKVPILVSGANHVSFSCDAANRAQVKLIKTYENNLQN